MRLIYIYVAILIAAANSAAQVQFSNNNEDMGFDAIIDPAGKDFDFGTATGPYKPEYASFAELYDCPKWFRNAKFGIYMHWGLGSVAGFDGHYGRGMYWSSEPDSLQMNNSVLGYRESSRKIYDYHCSTFGHPSKFGYKDFIDLWKPEKFDAEALADLYVEAGARFIGVMAVHHDNFDLYDSSFQPWNSVNMGPHIDVVGAWRDAVKKRGLRFAITSHLSNYFHEHAFYQGPECDADGPNKGIPYDYCDSIYNGLYGKRTPGRMQRLQPDFAINWYHRTKELMDKYQPDLVYFDGPLPNGIFGRQLAAHFYNSNIGPDGKTESVITIKRRHPGLTLDIESSGIDRIMEYPFLTDTSVNPGWFYLGGSVNAAKDNGDAGIDDESSADKIRLSAGQIVDNLIDVVSKNGCMMLNVGLRPDGSLPGSYAAELRKIGRWLRKYGEAIYETRPFKTFGEGPFNVAKYGKTYGDHLFSFSSEDIRFTTRPGKLYVICLQMPEDREWLHVKSLVPGMLDGIVSVDSLGDTDDIEWKQTDDGLFIKLAGLTHDEYANVFRINLRLD